MSNCYHSPVCLRVLDKKQGEDFVDLTLQGMKSQDSPFVVRIPHKNGIMVKAIWGIIGSSNIYYLYRGNELRGPVVSNPINIFPITEEMEIDWANSNTIPDKVQMIIEFEEI